MNQSSAQMRLTEYGGQVVFYEAIHHAHFPTTNMDR
jgi:hypothetical protein